MSFLPARGIALSDYRVSGGEGPKFQAAEKRLMDSLSIPCQFTLKRYSAPAFSIVVCLVSEKTLEIEPAIWNLAVGRG